jgi:hypothetical protein
MPEPRKEQEPRVPIGDAAADEDKGEPAPSGLPPGHEETAEDDPESQETG